MTASAFGKVRRRLLPATIGMVAGISFLIITSPSIAVYIPSPENFVYNATLSPLLGSGK